MLRFLFLVPIALKISYAQITPLPSDSSDDSRGATIEKLLENNTQDLEHSQLLDELERLEESPIDLNEASIDELTMIPTIDGTIAQAIIGKREHVGRFSDFDELTNIPGMDEDKLNALRTYSRIPSDDAKRFFRTLHTSYRGRIQQVGEDQAGFISGKYIGSKPKLYNRLIADDGAYVTGGILTEKDAGEKSFTDHTVGYLSARDLGFIRNVVVGDYTITSGQGVMLWSAYGFSKGSEVISSPKRSGRHLRPFLSSDENKFFRGAAAQAQFGAFGLTTFYSNHPLDASFDSSSGYVTSFDESGLHRTASEMLKQNTVQEKLFGAKLSSVFSTGALRSNVSLSGYRSRFDKDVFLQSPDAFAGKSSNMFGFDYDVFYSRLNFFGEWARSHTGAIGGISGLTAVPGKNIQTTVVYRNFPKDFVSLHGYAFGERNGSTQNEEGIYTGIQMNFSRSLKLYTYFDQFRFPGRTYFLPLPSSGHDFFLQTEWKPKQRLLLTFRYKREVKGDLATTLDENIQEKKIITDRAQQNLRIEMAYRPATSVQFRLRGEYVNVDYREAAANEHGYLFFADTRLTFSKRLLINARLAAFQTTSYDSRIYEFENDVTGVLSNPGLYGRGMRLYLLARYSPATQLDISAKFSETIRDGVKTIGSGYDEIQGDTQSQFSMQIDVKL